MENIFHRVFFQILQYTIIFPPCHIQGRILCEVLRTHVCRSLKHLFCNFERVVVIVVIFIIMAVALGVVIVFKAILNKTGLFYVVKI